MRYLISLLLLISVHVNIFCAALQVDERDIYGSTPLHQEIINRLGQTDEHSFYEQYYRVSKLIKCKADINAKNIFGETPLILAWYYGSIPSVELLLDAKANCNIESHGMDRRELESNIDILKILLDDSVDFDLEEIRAKKESLKIKSKEKYYEYTPVIENIVSRQSQKILNYASKINELALFPVPICKLIAKYSINLRSYQQCTENYDYNELLIESAAANDFDLIKYALLMKADINFRDPGPGIFQRLLPAKAPKNLFGWTLHFDNAELYNFLLKNNENLSINANFGQIVNQKCPKIVSSIILSVNDLPAERIYLEGQVHSLLGTCGKNGILVNDVLLRFFAPYVNNLLYYSINDKLTSEKLNFEDSTGTTPLMYAITRNHEFLFDLLTLNEKSGRIALSTTNKYGLSVLDLAKEKRCIAVLYAIKFSIEKSVNIIIKCSRLNKHLAKIIMGYVYGDLDFEIPKG